MVEFDSMRYDVFEHHRRLWGGRVVESGANGGSAGLNEALTSGQARRCQRGGTIDAPTSWPA